MKCSKCGLEYEGESCPKCGNSTLKPKKPFYKKWWFIVIVIIVAIMLIGKIFGGSSNSKDKPEKFNWSSFSLHEKLPEPKSNEGTDFYDYDDSLTVTVSNTTKNDYNEYVEKCETDYGFTTEKKKTSDSFSAVNSENYSLSLTYDDDDKEMTIQLELMAEDTAETVESTDTTVAPAEEESTESKQTVAKPAESNSTSGMSKEFKDAMDSYEKFMNEYVEFMKKYNSNPNDIGLLTEYSKYLKNYNDMCSKFEKWKNEDLNSAEMAYYLDVQSRVSKKLLEVAG